MTPDPIDELQLARSEREMYRKGCELFQLRIRELEKERKEGWWNENKLSSSDLHQAIRDLRSDAEKIGGFNPENWTFKDPFCAKVHEVLVDVSVELVSLQETVDDLMAALEEKPKQP